MFQPSDRDALPSFTNYTSVTESCTTVHECGLCPGPATKNIPEIVVHSFLSDSGLKYLEIKHSETELLCPNPVTTNMLLRRWLPRFNSDPE